ncbi:Alkaline phosphatase [Microcystis panniformis FACHB-1757]|uniref:Alkaline phosphatase n=1 Tax=Microcystis panniformis FACHB-1757 TaxID=1638788 RepID=A0A0K1RXY4_9CHRO|nr:Alkaline phosphatase [Microcystis panniformis FACHB-1757]
MKVPIDGSSRLCVIIFAYGTLKCLLGKTFRTILRIFYRYRPRFHTETRRAY